MSEQRKSGQWQCAAWSALLLVVVGLVACGGGDDRAAEAQAALPVMTVYKSPTCGCCVAWVDHLRANGLTVEVVDEPQMNPLKGSLGVPGDLRSCHTATIGDYVVEGHVPAQDIQRLLAERPAVQGLAVPGMPIGSPGMEMGDRVDPYEVIAFQGEQRQVFAQHRERVGATDESHAGHSDHGGH